MASQIQKESHLWDTDPHLRFLLNFINQSLHTLPSPLFDHNKKFTGRDMDKLLPDQFRQIVGLIFKEQAPAHLEEALTGGGPRLAPLTSFANLYQGFSSAMYDGQQLKLYRSLRKLFPLGDATLTPCVVINPAGDPVRTRNVLRYLTVLALFVDQIESQFEEVSEQLAESSKEYDELISRLDELKTEIVGRLAQLDDWKQEIPFLEEKSTQLSKEAISLEEQVTNLESDVQNLEKVFTRMKDSNRILFQQNESVKAEIAAKGEKIVPNGEILMQEYKIESDKVLEMKEYRKRFGEQLKTLQEKQSFYASINEKVSFLIQCFKDVIQQMNDADYGKNDRKRLEGEHQEKIEAVNDIKRKLNGLRAHGVVTTAEGSNTNREKEQQLKEIRKQVIFLTRKADETFNDLDEMRQRSIEKAQVLSSKRQLADKLRQKITEDEDYALSMSATADQHAMDRIIEVREQLAEEFGHLLSNKVQF